MLLAFAIERSRAAGISTDSRTKYRQLAKSLAAYIGEGRDEPITVQAREGWLRDYYRFLLDDYRANKDDNADPDALPAIRSRRAADHLRTLRRLNFNAVEQGILPDVDFLAVIPDIDLSRSKNIITPDFADQVAHLINIRTQDATFAGAIDRYLLALSLCGLPLRLLDEVLDTIGEDTAGVHLPHLDITVPLSAPLRHLALTIKSRRANKPEEYSGPSETRTNITPENGNQNTPAKKNPEGQSSIEHPASPIDEGSPTAEPEKDNFSFLNFNFSLNKYTSLFSHLGVSLMRSGSPFTDWLSLCQQIAGATSSDLITLMRRELTGRRCALVPHQPDGNQASNNELQASNQASSIVHRASKEEKQNSQASEKELFTIHYSFFTEVSDFIADLSARAASRHYYAVKVYGTTAEEALANLPADAPALWPALQGHIWCPCTTRRPTTNIERIVARRGKVVDERRTVMRDLFFASATTTDIARLDRTVPNLWVFQTRQGTTRRYTRISPVELRAMRSILDRLTSADDVEFAITDTPAPAADFAESDTALLLLPGFENIEAHITKKIEKKEKTTRPNGRAKANVEKEETETTVYKIWFLTADGKRIEMTVPPHQLKMKIDK